MHEECSLAQQGVHASRNRESGRETLHRLTNFKYLTCATSIRTRNGIRSVPSDTLVCST